MMKWLWSLLGYDYSDPTETYESKIIRETTKVSNDIYDFDV